MLNNFYIYPNFSKALVSGLKTILTNLGETDFRVATKKLPLSADAPSVEIIVNVETGSPENLGSIRTDGCTIIIWVTKGSETLAYSEADRLAELISQAITLLPNHTDVSWVEPGSWSPVEDEGETQVRSILSEGVLVPQKKDYS